MYVRIRHGNTHNRLLVFNRQKNLPPRNIFYSFVTATVESGRGPEVFFFTAVTNLRRDRTEPPDSILEIFSKRNHGVGEKYILFLLFFCNQYKWKSPTVTLSGDESTKHLEYNFFFHRFTVVWTNRQFCFFGSPTQQKYSMIPERFTLYRIRYEKYNFKTFDCCRAKKCSRLNLIRDLIASTLYVHYNIFWRWPIVFYSRLSRPNASRAFTYKINK